MNVAEAVGRELVEAGVGQVFGVVGSGNFEVTNAMVAAGAKYVAARHEAGAATMADAYARMSGRVSAVTVHQGCGLTNAVTGMTEAAKSRTPMVVVAAEATNPTSNFHVDQAALARSIGAGSLRADDPSTAGHVAREAVEVAVADRRVVLLNLPLEVQAAAAPESEPDSGSGAGSWHPSGHVLEPHDISRLVSALQSAQRPVFVAGRGGRGARGAIEALASQCGALLATSAVAKGLFNENPWYLDVSGGFSSPLAAELISGADLIVGWGCALNMWTMRHGRLIAQGARVIQVDVEYAAIGAQRDVEFGVLGDAAAVAEAALEQLPEPRTGYRTDDVRAAIADRVAWRDVLYDDRTADGRIDPRTLCLALDELLPAERVVGVDSGNFMGYPSMFLRVPDEFGFCFTQAYQCVGLGLATTIGAALAQPGRLPVAALGDGGALMAAAELETVVRLGLPMVVIVFNDQAYGAEVHHFGDTAPLDTVTFPDTDFAAIARGYGYDALTVRSREDLAPVADWLRDRSRPLLIDAKVVADEPSWWLAEAFGH